MSTNHSRGGSLLKLIGQICKNSRSRVHELCWKGFVRQTLTLIPSGYQNPSPGLILIAIGAHGSMNHRCWALAKEKHWWNNPWVHLNTFNQSETAPGAVKDYQDRNGHDKGAATRTDCHETQTRVQAQWRKRHVQRNSTGQNLDSYKQNPTWEAIW